MYWTPLIDIILTYLLFISIVVWEVVVRPPWWGILLAAVLLSLTLHRLGLFLHAAAHGEFHEDRAVSDRIYMFLLFWFFGVDIEPFRRVHFAHHRNFGKEDADPEDTYSKGLSFKTLASMITRRDAPSIALAQESVRYAQEGKPPVKGRRLPSILHLTILAALTVSNGPIGGAGYVGALFIGLPAIVHLRNVLEHFSPDGSAVSRNFKRGILSFFLGAAGFQAHGEHHRQPSVRYWLLPRPEKPVGYIETLRRV